MAYIGQKEKKELAPQIKAVLKKYKMKGTIKINNHMTLVVTCQSGDLNFNENFVSYTCQGRFQGATRKKSKKN